MAYDKHEQRHREATLFREEVHAAIAHLLPRHPELLEAARRRAEDWAPAATLPSPWQETRTVETAHSYWSHILSLDVDDAAAWILAFEDDEVMNGTSPFIPDDPSDLVRREITVLRRRRKGKTHDNTRPESKLARLRIERDRSQEEMVRLTGLKPSTYWRLERKRIKNPPIGYLAVCANVLEVSIGELVEDEYLAWRPNDS